MNEQKLEELVHTTAGYMIGAAVGAGIQLGDELGLYGAMAGTGASSADDVAERAGTNPRLTREWLDGQSAAGLVDYDADADRYTLSDEAVMILVNEESPVFLARGFLALGSLFIDAERIADAFRGDGALAWGDHHPCMFSGVEWFFRSGYRANLAAEWLPSLDGVTEQLQSGAHVADVGCGHGASVVAMAEAFPNARFTGIDFHEPSIEIARARAAEAGVSDRCSFQVADAQAYEGDFDVICFFDCLHDMGDPVGAARHANSRLIDGGSVLLVEPFALDGRGANIAQNPFAALTYHASSMICTPNSLSQDVGLGLGGQAGEARLSEVVAKAGFSRLERRAETPFNLILQAHR